MQTTISCPACHQGSFILDPQLLTTGHAFGCSNCDAKIALSASGRQTLENGIEKYSKAQADMTGLQEKARTPMAH